MASLDLFQLCTRQFPIGKMSASEEGGFGSSLEDLIEHLEESANELVAKGLTGLPVREEIVVALVLLCGMTGLLVLLAGWPEGLSSSSSGMTNDDDTFAAVVLTKAQRRQVELLRFPASCVSSSRRMPSLRRQSSASTANPRQEQDEEGSATNSAKFRRRVRDMTAQLRTVGEKVFEFDLEEYSKKSFGRTPLLVFVNKKSGGQNGDLLLRQLRAFLPEWQVHDIGRPGEPEAGLNLFRDVPNFRIMVAGGDGTASWIMATIDVLRLPYRPPLAVLPVGTGNDLARVLGWGGGTSGFSSGGNALVRHLLDVLDGEVTMLDRWQVQCTSPSKFKKDVVMNNYLGIGVDAQISLNFHLNRESLPHLFTSRFINKYVWYASSGGKEILMQRFSGFPKFVTLEADGKYVDLPPGTEGIILLNIKSYGGGVNLWGGETANESENDEDQEEEYFSESDFEELRHSRSPAAKKKPATIAHRHKHRHRRHRSNPPPRMDTFYPAAPDDHMFEIVSVASSFQLGAAQVGLARPTQLCQASEVKIYTARPLPIQIDGEPFNLPAKSTIKIKYLNQGMMLSRSPGQKLIEFNESTRVITQVLEWAQKQDVIDERQKQIIQQEVINKLSRRKRRHSVESIT